MPARGGFEVVRDPLWNNIRIDPPALRVLDSEPFQRLRYVRQLGHAFLVYPGATHTRFEHALGTYHLAGRALALLDSRGALGGFGDEDAELVRLAALLHDIGHYPFSHGLEEAGLPHHESLALEHFAEPGLAAALAGTGVPDVAARLAGLITGRSASPLQGLISGPLDLDKIEYLTRDARMCGVPYGTVDVDRLLHSLTLVSTGDGLVVGLHAKGVSALESLLFAKYQMYRNVYWHHAVRSATAMFKRVVRTAIGRETLTPAWIARATDEALLEALRHEPLVDRLRHRRLYKRVLDVPATALPPDAGDWVATDPDLVAAVEDRLADELGLGPGEVLLDYPAKPEMLSGDVLVVDREGTVSPARLGILEVAQELHTAARHLRVFAARRVAMTPAAGITLIERGAPDLTDAVRAGASLLRG